MYYVFNLLVPCILIASITLLGFLLPVDSGEKVSLGITVLLSLTVFLLLIAQSMPPSSVVPIIGIHTHSAIDFFLHKSILPMYFNKTFPCCKRLYSNSTGLKHVTKMSVTVIICKYLKERK